VLQVDPDNERAYNRLNILYHDKLFAFADAFDLNQAWLERHPNQLASTEVVEICGERRAGATGDESGAGTPR
jgi:hypothetical protein